MILTQLGVGPSEGFLIKDKNAVWTDFIPDGIRLEMVKSYTYLKVKLLFDPPISSSAMEANNRMIEEFEWRLNIAADKESNQTQGNDIASTDSVTLTDVDTNIDYDIYVSNGKLNMEKSDIADNSNEYEA